ncbi:IS110 family transposase [Rhodococcus wratislaviensis]|uniref:IS110 family transposase n=1 Tax=Rhodococcus wratislaviensis TaxID=44752 RepID=UPI0036596E73
MLAYIGDHDQDPVPVAIETPRGLLVAALRSTERRVYAINPMAVARFRERWTPARSKSDHADAMVLANILRTDQQRHRPLPGDSELVRSIAVPARAHQDATWPRTKAVHELRSLLREYCPGFLEAFAEKGPANLSCADARARSCPRSAFRSHAAGSVGAGFGDRRLDVAGGLADPPIQLPNLTN